VIPLSSSFKVSEKPIATASTNSRANWREFEVFPEVTGRITVFWNVIPCSLVDISRTPRLEAADLSEVLVIMYETGCYQFQEQSSLKVNELSVLALHLPLQGKAS
jgi:hypothetical protein